MKRHGDLPTALANMRDAVAALTEPVAFLAGRPDCDGCRDDKCFGHRTWLPSRYEQLCGAVTGQRGDGDHAAQAGTPGIWIAALDLLNEIDVAVECWQRSCTGSPPTVVRLHALMARSWAPEALRGVEQITSVVGSWVGEIDLLLIPETVKTFSAPCPHCGATVVRRMIGGELLRQPALQLNLSRRVCACMACGDEWPSDMWDFLALQLGCTPIPGVIAESA